MDDAYTAYDDLYNREEKNPTKKKSPLQILLKILLPLIVLGLIVLLIWQFYVLSKVGGTVAEKPDEIEPVVTEGD